MRRASCRKKRMMMKFFNWFLVAIASMLLFSCVQKEEMELVEENMAPIVRLGEEVLPDAVLVKFVSAPDESQLLSLEKEYDVTLERVFNSTPGKEELERKHGLDRWYKALFPETEDVDTKARLSMSPSARTMQRMAFMPPTRRPPGPATPYSTIRT